MEYTATAGMAPAPLIDDASMCLPVGEGVPELEVRFGYRIGSCAFVLEQTLLTEIVIRPVIYTIPHSPAWFRGVINLRGNIVVVLDLSSALGTVAGGNPGDYVLVVDKGRDALGLLVDVAPKSLSNPQPLAYAQPPNPGCTPYFQPGIQAEDTVWNQLDVIQLALALGSNT